MCLVISLLTIFISVYLFNDGFYLSAVVSALMGVTLLGLFIRNALKNGACVFLGRRDCQKTSKGDKSQKSD